MWWCCSGLINPGEKKQKSQVNIEAGILSCILFTAVPHAHNNNRFLLYSVSNSVSTLTKWDI